MSSYYTCFKFKNYEQKRLHCTHKYFGKQTEENVEKIIEIISNYLDQNKIDSFSPVFDKEDFFGQNSDLRVLKTDVNLHNFILDLKEKLDEFKLENHPVYSPHVTTKEFEKVTFPFFSYVLVKDGQVYKEWLLENYNEQE